MMTQEQAFLKAQPQLPGLRNRRDQRRPTQLSIRRGPTQRAPPLLPAFQGFVPTTRENATGPGEYPPTGPPTNCPG
jgi:hypothetical protein